MVYYSMYYYTGMGPIVLRAIGKPWSPQPLAIHHAHIARRKKAKYYSLIM